MGPGPRDDPTLRRPLHHKGREVEDLSCRHLILPLQVKIPLSRNGQVMGTPVKCQAERGHSAGLAVNEDLCPPWIGINAECPCRYPAIRIWFFAPAPCLLMTIRGCGR